MKLIKCLLISSAVFFILSVSSVSADSSLHINLTAELLVDDTEEAGRIFTAWAEEKNGYFLKYSNTGVVLRIPKFNSSDLDILMKNNGEIVYYSYNSENLDDQITTLKGQLFSREKLLSDFYSLLGKSDFKSTLSLEREMSSLLREIEGLKGRIKRYEHDKIYALIDIRFYSDQQYTESEISSFDWINSIDFHLLMNEEADFE
jgi:uncharacterized protein DUF4349